jgi:hypothetical protein
MAFASDVTASPESAPASTQVTDIKQRAAPANMAEFPHHH